MRQRLWMGGALIALGWSIALVAVLGPLMLGLLEHRTSETTLNQLIGVDAAGLFLIAPLSIAAGVLALRRHPAAPVLALAPAAYTAYTFARWSSVRSTWHCKGNVERSFPLLLAVFVIAGVIAVGAWTAIDAEHLPRPRRRLERLAGGALLFAAVFLVLGLHLPTLSDALSDQPTRVEYVSSPTAFWVVKMMDLGIVVPAAIASGLTLLRGRDSARKPMYAILGGYTLIGASVAAMAITMLVSGDPDASLGLTTAFTLFALALALALALAFAALSVSLYRPLFNHDEQRVRRDAVAATTPSRVPR